MSLIAEISTELERAATARAAGNERRTRVCARRAAGMAARDFLKRNQGTALHSAQGGTRNSRTYEALRTVAAFPAHTPDLNQAADHLTMRVNDEFQLPPGTDLIIEAYKIIEV